ncbi:MAG: hypothetical protein F6K24_03445 [Okeania sp. SIO2D1]|nr:hypothetical protein [Okeania sp. SIO2D1]
MCNLVALLSDRSRRRDKLVRSWSHADLRPKCEPFRESYNCWLLLAMAQLAT